MRIGLGFSLTQRRVNSGVPAPFVPPPPPKIFINPLDIDHDHLLATTIATAFDRIMWNDDVICWNNEGLIFDG